MSTSLVLVLGVSLLFTHVRADCTYTEIASRLSRCTVMQPDVSSINNYRTSLEKFCQNMDENLNCSQTMYGNDCSENYNAVADFVGTKIICDNIYDAVHAMVKCLSNNVYCLTSYSNAVSTASSAYIGSGDIGALRADLCNAFPLFEQRCTPFPVTGSCTAFYADFASDLYTLTLAGPVCPSRDLSNIYVKYGFTKLGILRSDRSNATIIQQEQSPSTKAVPTPLSRAYSTPSSSNATISQQEQSPSTKAVTTPLSRAYSTPSSSNATIIQQEQSPSTKAVPTPLSRAYSTPSSGNFNGAPYRSMPWILQITMLITLVFLACCSC